MRINNKVILGSIILLMAFFAVGCQSELPVEMVEEGALSDETDMVQEELVEKDVIENADSQESVNIIKFYIIADRTGTRESGISIEQGIRTALDEVDNLVNGMVVEIVLLDHRGSSPRAQQHLQDYLSDDKALVVFSGLHSPPILASRDFINENQIVLLDPWAAAGPITRYPSPDNWIFRLSIDDTKAGQMITEYAIENEGYQKPLLLLEETGWGESNEINMRKALDTYDIQDVETTWFNWSLGKNQAKVLLRQADKSGADVIFFVGNAPEGKVFANAMSELPKDERLPIRSHWGITGGDFPEVINKTIRNKIDLKFIQTSFSFINMEDHVLGNEVLERAKKLFPESIKDAKDISAPTGFIHGYDLTKVLIQAMRQIEFDGNIVRARRSVRDALENLSEPVEGLIKTYDKPFSVYSDENIDAHEALNIKDLKMAEYGDDNEIKLLD